VRPLSDKWLENLFALFHLSFKESRQATRMAWLSMSNALKKEAGPSLTLPEEMRMRN